MKINPTDRCLSLILHALDTGVLPEITSASAIQTIGLIKITLSDLLKRHQKPAYDFMGKCIEEGQRIEREIALVLDGAGGALETPVDPTNERFEALVGRYDELTKRLDQMGIRLTTEKPEDSRTERLLRQSAEWEMSYLTGQAALSVDFFNTQESLLPAPSQSIPLQEFLPNFLSERYESLELLELSEVAGGFGKQTYIAKVKHSTSDAEELVVRKSQPHPMVLHSGFLLEREFHLLKSLSKTDYPSPHPIQLAHDLPGLESTFMTMKRVPGTVLGNFLEGEANNFAEDIWKQLATLLAKLHAIPLVTFQDYFSIHGEQETLNESVETRHRRNLEGWRNYVQRVEHLPSPYITWLFHWLENNIPSDPRPPVLTHGDFSVHNVLAVDGQVTGVLDWECADFGAPEQDLAYIKPHVVRHVPWDTFLKWYKESGGQEVDKAKMPWCLAYGVLRTFLGGTRATTNLQMGRNTDIRYVMMELGFAPTFMKMGLDYTAEGQL